MKQYSEHKKEAWQEIEEIEQDLKDGLITQADADFLIYAISEEFCCSVNI